MYIDAYRFNFYRFGIESIVYTSKGPDEPSVFTYDEEKNALIAGDVTIKMFDTVKVEIKVEGDETGMRQKMRMSLVYPQVPGLEPSDQSSKKRKAQETKNGSQNTKRQAKAKIAA